MRYEEQVFPAGTQAIVIDTDMPVTEHFADNFCSYCTGLIGKKSVDSWRNRYFEDFKMDPSKQATFDSKGVAKWHNPYLQYACYVCRNEFWTPCCPWPTP